ncbi:cell surface protein [Lactobacillus curvatus]|nr:cell surface protein [Latilactobacillus curvatus]MSE24045.1 cell surface protein [Latilactobacillus curvatus]
MKFTRFTSTVLTASALLAILAPATIANAATPKDDSAANGGTKLPMTDTTDAGISFGDTHDNGNSGYLRLQMVPKTLDFGNHAKYVAAHSNFDATGANLGVVGNDTHASFDQQDSNKTETLTTNDAKLKAVQGTAWTTVVDKQAENPELVATKANTAGDWKLTVSADGNGLKAGGHTIADANLVFANTQYGRTADIYGLTTKDVDDDGYKATGTTDATYAKSVSLNLSTPNEEKVVGTATTGAGDGANVFGWKPTDIRLALNGSNDVATGEYHAGLTWTLNTTI